MLQEREYVYSEAKDATRPSTNAFSISRALSLPLLVLSLCFAGVLGFIAGRVAECPTASDRPVVDSKSKVVLLVIAENTITHDYVCSGQVYLRLYVQ